MDELDFIEQPIPSPSPDSPTLSSSIYSEASGSSVLNPVKTKQARIDVTFQRQKSFIGMHFLLGRFFNDAYV